MDAYESVIQDHCPDPLERELMNEIWAGFVLNRWYILNCPSHAGQAEYDHIYKQFRDNDLLLSSINSRLSGAIGELGYNRGYHDETGRLQYVALPSLTSKNWHVDGFDWGRIQMVLERERDWVESLQEESKADWDAYFAEKYPGRNSGRKRGEGGRKDKSKMVWG